MSDNKATKAAKKNTGLFGGAARALSERQQRIEDAINGTTRHEDDVNRMVKEHVHRTQ